MHPLIPAAPNPPPRATAGIFLPCLSQGDLQILLCQEAGHSPAPGLFPSMRFSTRLTEQRILLEKQAYWHICQGPKKIEEGCKGMFSILCLFVFHCISSQNHMAKSGAIRTWINVFFYMKYLHANRNFMPPLGHTACMSWFLHIV